MEKIVVSMDADVHRSFFAFPDRNSMLPDWKPDPCDANNAPMLTTKFGDHNTAAQAERDENWNVVATFCSDGNFHIPSKVYVSSSSSMALSRISGFLLGIH